MDTTTHFIKAPWTPEQVDALNRYQRLGHVHEFTCPTAHEADRTLLAMHDGWHCPHCDYRQDWAHEQMLNAQPLEKMVDTLPCDVMLPPATVIRKGCEFSTLMVAFKARALNPAETNRFDDPSRASRASRLSEASDVFRNVTVVVTGRDYRYEGRLAGVAWKVSGVMRYVVEDDHGRLFIHNADQLGEAEGWVP